MFFFVMKTKFTSNFLEKTFVYSLIRSAINFNIFIIPTIQIELEPWWQVNPRGLVVSRSFGIAWVKAILLMKS